MKGRRLPDTVFGEIPSGARPGDYWKYLERGLGDVQKPMQALHPMTNLTDTVWGFYSPDGNGMGTLMQHTVREHDDGSISILPGDGSSNSVLHQGGASGKVWHGYVYEGEWREC